MWDEIILMKGIENCSSWRCWRNPYTCPRDLAQVYVAKIDDVIDKDNLKCANKHFGMIVVESATFRVLTVLGDSSKSWACLNVGVHCRRSQANRRA